MATKAGYLDVKLPLKGRGIHRKPWRRRWVVLQTMANLNEDKTLAKLVFYVDQEDWKTKHGEKESLFLEDVTHIRRCPSKTRYYAFCVSGNNQTFVNLAVGSETECQAWMMIIRAIFWPLPAPIDMKKICNKSFRVNIIDNAASFGLTLEGSYVMQFGAQSLILFHATGNAVAHEWMYTTLAKFYIPHMVQKVDQNRVLAVLAGTCGQTSRVPYLFFCEDATKILVTIKGCIENTSSQLCQREEGEAGSLTVDTFHIRRHPADAVLQDSEYNSENDISHDSLRRASWPGIPDYVPENEDEVLVNQEVDGNPPRKPISDNELDYDKLTIRQSTIFTSVNTVSHRPLGRTMSDQYKVCTSCTRQPSEVSTTETDRAKQVILEAKGSPAVEKDAPNMDNLSDNAPLSTHFETKDHMGKENTVLSDNELDKLRKRDDIEIPYSPIGYVINYKVRSKTEPTVSTRLIKYTAQNLRRCNSTSQKYCTHNDLIFESPIRTSVPSGTAGYATKTSVRIHGKEKQKKAGAYKHVRRRAASAACQIVSDSDEENSEPVCNRKKLVRCRSLTDSEVNKPRSNSKLERRNAFRFKLQAEKKILSDTVESTKAGSDADASGDTTDTDASKLLNSDDPDAMAQYNLSKSLTIPEQNTPKDNSDYATLNTERMLQSGDVCRFSPKLPPLRRRRPLNTDTNKFPIKSHSMIECSPSIIRLPRRPESCHSDISWPCAHTLTRPAKLPFGHYQDEVTRTDSVSSLDTSAHLPMDKDEPAHIYMELDAIDIFTSNHWETKPLSNNTSPPPSPRPEVDGQCFLAKLGQNFHEEPTKYIMEYFYNLEPPEIPAIMIMQDDSDTESELGVCSDTQLLYNDHNLELPEMPPRSSSAPDKEVLYKFRANLKKRRQSAPNGHIDHVKQNVNFKKTTLEVENCDKHIFCGKDSSRLVTYATRKMSLPANLHNIMRPFMSKTFPKKKQYEKLTHEMRDVKSTSVYTGSCSKTAGGQCATDHVHAGRSTFFGDISSQHSKFKGYVRHSEIVTSNIKVDRESLDTNISKSRDMIAVPRDNGKQNNFVNEKEHSNNKQSKFGSLRKRHSGTNKDKATKPANKTLCRQDAITERYFPVKGDTKENGISGSSLLQDSGTVSTGIVQQSVHNDAVPSYQTTNVVPKKFAPNYAPGTPTHAQHGRSISSPVGDNSLLTESLKSPDGMHHQSDVDPTSGRWEFPSNAVMHSKSRGQHGESGSSISTVYSYSTEEDQEECDNISPLNSDEEDATFDSLATPNSTRLDSNLPNTVQNRQYYRSLPQLRGAERYMMEYADKSDGNMHYLSGCGMRRRKNLFNYLGMPAGLKNPLESPPSLPDRPKQPISPKRASKSRGIRWSVMKSLGMINKSRPSYWESSEGSPEKEDLFRQSLTQITEWPLESHTSSAKRRSLVMRNDLYSNREEQSSDSLDYISPDSSSESSALTPGCPFDALEKLDVKKTAPEPFPGLMEYSSRQKLRHKNKYQTKSGMSSDFADNIENQEVAKKKDSDSSLKAILSEQLQCNHDCSHMRRSPMNSEESTEPSPCHTPRRSRSSSQEIEIPVIISDTLSTTPDSVKMSFENTYMSMGQSQQAMLHEVSMIPSAFECPNDVILNLDQTAANSSRSTSTQYSHSKTCQMHSDSGWHPTSVLDANDATHNTTQHDLRDEFESKELYLSMNEISELIPKSETNPTADEDNGIRLHGNSDSDRSEICHVNHQSAEGTRLNSAALSSPCVSQSGQLVETHKSDPDSDGSTYMSMNMVADWLDHSEV